MALAIKYRSNVWDMVFHPIAMIYITVISIKLIFGTGKKFGVRWQGRQYTVN